MYICKCFATIGRFFNVLLCLLGGVGGGWGVGGGGGGGGISLECELDTKTLEENMGLVGAKTLSVKNGVVMRGKLELRYRKGDFQFYINLT
jgi:hypothetical protein